MSEIEQGPRTTKSNGELIEHITRRVIVLPDEQIAAREARIEEARVETIAAVLRESWQAPRRHVDTSVDRSGPWGIRLSEIESAIMAGKIWALIGARGNGKTQLAVEAMRTWTSKGRSARYATAVEMFVDIKATYRKDSTESEAQVIARYRKPRLLVIDEMSKRAETDWENTILFEILNKRYGDKTDTILIANLAPADFSKNIDFSIARRLNETGGVIVCDWPARF